MGIGDLGLGIGDWGLGIGPNPQSPIPNPQSPIPNVLGKKLNKRKNQIIYFFLIIKTNIYLAKSNIFFLEFFVL